LYFAEILTDSKYCFRDKILSQCVLINLTWVIPLREYQQRYQ